MRSQVDPLHPDGTDPDVVCIAGDWHGNTRWAVRMIELAAGRTRVILHVGDWGLRSESPAMVEFLSRQNRLLDAIDCYLTVTPGNHENYDRLAALQVDPHTGLQKLTNRIWFAPRGYRWRWGASTWMSLGGAVSVDRERRRVGRDWWTAEALTEVDVASAIAGGPVDVLLTHDAPAGARVPGLQSGRWPEDAISDSERNRRLLRRVVDHCRPRQIWHGHMHVRYSDRIDLGPHDDRPDWDGLVHVHGLDCDNGRWQDNLALASTNGSRLEWPAGPSRGQQPPVDRS